MTRFPKAFLCPSQIIWNESQSDQNYQEVLPGLVIAAGGCGQAAKCCDEIGWYPSNEVFIGINQIKYWLVSIK